MSKHTQYLLYREMVSRKRTPKPEMKMCNNFETLILEVDCDPDRAKPSLFLIRSCSQSNTIKLASSCNSLSAAASSTGTFINMVRAHSFLTKTFLSTPKVKKKYFETTRIQMVSKRADRPTV